MYVSALQRGHNAAWDGQWTKAISDYRCAASEFPEDAMVHLSLGHALEESGQLEEALSEFHAAAKLQPRDPLFLLRVAALHEKMRQHTEAAATLLEVAEIYLAQEDGNSAIRVCEIVSALESDEGDLPRRLSETYERAVECSRVAMEFKPHRSHNGRDKKAKATDPNLSAPKLDPYNKGTPILHESVGHEELANPSNAPDLEDKRTRFSNPYPTQLAGQLGELPKRRNRISASRMIAIAMIVAFLAAVPQVYQLQKNANFTEFYMGHPESLEKNGKEWIMNEPIALFVCIANHEEGVSAYRVIVERENQVIGAGSTISLEDGESRCQSISLVIPVAGDHQEVNVFLEKGGASFPYRGLHLWVDVKPISTDKR